jgi:hypothetical protein
MTNRCSQKQLVFSFGLMTALLIPLLPLPQPIAGSGHPWKVELSLFLVLSVFFVFKIFGKDPLV